MELEASVIVGLDIWTKLTHHDIREQVVEQQVGEQLFPQHHQITECLSYFAPENQHCEEENIGLIGSEISL